MSRLRIALLLALLVAALPGPVQAEVSPGPEGAPVVDATRPETLGPDERPVLYVPAGRPVHLALRVAGDVAESPPAVLELRFHEPLWFYGPETGEPLVSRDGRTWRRFPELFRGSLSVGMTREGLQVQLEMNDR